MSAARSTTAVVALGSNVGRRRNTILSGVTALARRPGVRLVATSPLRETDAVGCARGTPPFINGACRLETTLSARQLLQALLAIEADHGRRRRDGSDNRTLDLDLILHGDTVLDEPGLRVPHPRAWQRPFVLQPAADVAPELRHPLLGRTLAELFAESTGASSSSANANIGGLGAAG